MPITFTDFTKFQKYLFALQCSGSGVNTGEKRDSLPN